MNWDLFQEAILEGVGLVAVLGAIFLIAQWFEVVLIPAM